MTELTAPSWEAPVRAGLQRMLREHGAGGSARDEEQPPLAALDWDDTCIHGDISETCLALLDRDVPEDLVGTYQRGCAEDVERAYVDLVHTLVAGRTPDEVRALAEAGLADGLRSGRIAWRPSMEELVRALLEHGFEVCVITASPGPLVRPLAARYGLAASAVVGMRSMLGPDGRYLPRLAAPPTHFDGKLATVRARFGRPPLFAAGDSRSDATVMRSARYALLLDRGDPELRTEAHARDWWVHHGETGA